MNALQFGTGRFLRGFFDPIIIQPNSIVVVQSQPDSNGAAMINDAKDGYHVWTRGKWRGQIVDEFELVRSLDRALVAGDQWQELQQTARDPAIQLVISNTTEQGLQLDPRDDHIANPSSVCPNSYPAKLLVLMHDRYATGGLGLTVLPMELVPDNGQCLKQLVLQQARIWNVTNDQEFFHWLEHENRWLTNLVDRIVVGINAPPPWEQVDPLAVVAEPFCMLALQDDGGPRTVLPAHPMVQWVEDLSPIFIQKVRILNGLHTSMVARCLPLGFETVLSVISDSRQRAWIEELLREEILPTLRWQGIDAEQFAWATLERFENPFFEHRLADIAKNHASKLETRIVPTANEFREAFGREPAKLNQVLNAESLVN